MGKTNEPTKTSQQISPNKKSNELKAEDEKSTATELEIVETDVKNNNSDVKCEKIEEISEKDNEVKKEIMECKENGTFLRFPLNIFQIFCFKKKEKLKGRAQGEF